MGEGRQYSLKEKVEERERKDCEWKSCHISHQLIFISHSPPAQTSSVGEGKKQSKFFFQIEKYNGPKFLPFSLHFSLFFKLSIQTEKASAFSPSNVPRHINLGADDDDIEICLRRRKFSFTIESSLQGETWAYLFTLRRLNESFRLSPQQTLHSPGTISKNRKMS